MESLGEFSKSKTRQGGAFEQGVKMFWRANRIEKTLGDKDWHPGRSVSDGFPHPSSGLDHGVPPAGRYSGVDVFGISAFVQVVRLPTALRMVDASGDCETGEDAGYQPGESDKGRVLICIWPHKRGAYPGKVVEIRIQQDLAEGHQSSR